MRNERASLWVAAAAMAALFGCSAQPVALVNLTRNGDQWVWPFFVEGRPTVLAFWTTDEMQCLRDIPALKALDARETSVELVTVVTGRDRYEIEKWLRGHKIRYSVLLDLEEKLARQLRVQSYPTFVYLDARGREIDRVTDIRLVPRWFDSPRWLERAGAPPPETYRTRA